MHSQKKIHLERLTTSEQYRSKHTKMPCDYFISSFGFESNQSQSKVGLSQMHSTKF